MLKIIKSRKYQEKKVYLNTLDVNNKNHLLDLNLSLFSPIPKSFSSNVFFNLISLNVIPDSTL